MAQWVGVEATRRAWSAKAQSASQRLMLLAIAKYADENCKAFPSVDSLCADTCLNKKTAFKVLKELKELGVLSVTKRPTNNSNEYTILAAGGCTETGSTNTGSTENGTTENGTSDIGSTVVPKTVRPVVPKTVHEQNREESKEENTTDIRPKLADDVPPPSVDDYGFDLMAEEREVKPAKAPRSCPIKKPEGVSDEDWADYKRLRREKRLPLTAKALKGLQAEADKAGKTMKEVVDICLENSWAGFKASWLKNIGLGRQTAPVPAPKSFADIDYSVGINPDGSF